MVRRKEVTVKKEQCCPSDRPKGEDLKRLALSPYDSFLHRY